MGRLIEKIVFGMKKEVYFCDRCGKEIKGEPNIVILMVGLEKYKKELDDPITDTFWKELNIKKYPDSIRHVFVGCRTDVHRALMKAVEFALKEAKQ